MLTAQEEEAVGEKQEQGGTREDEAPATPWQALEKLQAARVRLMLTCMLADMT